MFSIYLKNTREHSDSVLIYDDLNPDPMYSLIDVTLTREDNASGSLEFEVPLSNIGYSLINPYEQDSDIFVYKKGYKNTYGLDGTDDVYWSGRIASVSKDISNHKTVYCEGVLAFLNDTIQTPSVYETVTDDNDAWQTDASKTSLHTYIGYLLDERHNLKVAPNRRIYLGETTAVYEPTKWYTNFETTMEILEDIASATGGHLRIRRSVRDGASAWVLDLLNDDIWIEGETDSNGIVMTEDNKWRYRWIPNYDQDIEFGSNMLDLSQAFDISEIKTKVYPLGKRKDESTIEGIDEYITIDDCDPSDIPELPEGVTIETDPQNYKYLKSAYADLVGGLETVEHYDDVDNPSELISLGILSLTMPDDISFEVEASAIDASYRDYRLKPIDVFDLIQVIAIPHGLNGAFLKVSKSEMPLDKPSDTRFTIGTTISKTFTELASKNNKSLFSEIKYLSVKPYLSPNEGGQ